MNLSYWDQHKILSVGTGILLVVFAIINIIASNIEEKAAAEAIIRLTYNEGQALLKFSNLYDYMLPHAYQVLESLSAVIWIIILFGGLYATLTALNIPECYQTKEQKTNTKS